MSKFNDKELKDEFAIRSMEIMIEAAMVGNIKFKDWGYVAEDCYDLADAIFGCQLVNSLRMTYERNND